MRKKDFDYMGESKKTSKQENSVNDNPDSGKSNKSTRE